MEKLSLFQIENIDKKYYSSTFVLVKNFCFWWLDNQLFSFNLPWIPDNKIDVFTKCCPEKNWFSVGDLADGKFLADSTVVLPQIDVY